MLANNRQVKSTGKNKWQQAKGQERGQRTKQGQGAREQGRKEGERIMWSRQRSWKEAANTVADKKNVAFSHQNNHFRLNKSNERMSRIYNRILNG